MATKKKIVKKVLATGPYKKRVTKVSERVTRKVAKRTSVKKKITKAAKQKVKQSSKKKALRKTSKKVSRKVPTKSSKPLHKKKTTKITQKRAVKKKGSKALEIKAKRLIERGRERGYVTYDQILKEFPKIEENIVFLEEMYERFSVASIDVLEGGGLLGGADIEEDILGKKNLYRRSESSYDSIQMYLREIGQYPL